MTLAPSGMLEIAAARLEYRMIGPAPGEAPMLVLLWPTPNVSYSLSDRFGKPLSPLWIRLV